MTRYENNDVETRHHPSHYVLAVGALLVGWMVWEFGGGFFTAVLVGLGIAVVGGIVLAFLPRPQTGRDTQETRGRINWQEDEDSWEVEDEYEWQREQKRERKEARIRIASDWKDLLDREEVFILDTETTGLESYDEIIEVAVIDTTGATRHHSLVKPKGRVSAGARRVHGITPSMLKDAPEWPHVYEELMPLLKSAFVVLGWNARFDRRLLRQTSRIYSLTPQLPKLPWRDLLRDYRDMAEYPHKLTDAVKRERAIIDGQSHRAVADCRAVLAVMRAVAG